MLPPKKTRGWEGEEGYDAKDGKKKPKWIKVGEKEIFQYPYRDY
jgi:hypothetical protein